MYQVKTLFTVLFLLLLSFSSCKKDSAGSSSTTTEPTASATGNNVQQGKWRVTLFNDSGRDETHHFTGYEFIFNPNGAARAQKGSTIVDGSWTTGTDDSKNKLILNFGATSPFDELNEDWRILENSASKIRLEHVSGGNGGTDLLTFEKI